MREPKGNIRASRRLLRQGGTSGQSQERAAAAAGAGGDMVAVGSKESGYQQPFRLSTPRTRPRVSAFWLRSRTCIWLAFAQTSTSPSLAVTQQTIPHDSPDGMAARAPAESALALR